MILVRESLLHSSSCLVAHGRSNHFSSLTMMMRDVLPLRRRRRRRRRRVRQNLSLASSSSSLGAWVPIGSASSLTGLDPVAMEIFGRRFCVWQKSPTTWSVMVDVCPHRLAPLSQGRVDATTKCIECPYHGWQFQSNGTLFRIPQLEQERRTFESIHGHDVTSYPVHLTGDLLWAFLPTSFHGESFPINLLPEDYYSDIGNDIILQSTWYVRDLPYSWDFLVENLMDGPAHLPFAHHSLGSHRSNAAPVPMSILVSNFTHFQYKAKYIRRGELRERRFGLQRPFLASQLTRRGADKSWKQTLLFFAVPVKEGYSRVLTNFDYLLRVQKPKAKDFEVHIVNTR